jgi:ADP-heptose:LPS heptosyltransferase
MTWSPPPKPKVLIIKLRSIGDVIYNTVVYSPIKKAWPDAHLTVIVEPPSYDIVRYHPDIDRVLIFDKKTIQKKSGFIGNYLQNATTSLLICTKVLEERGCVS